MTAVASERTDVVSTTRDASVTHGAYTVSWCTTGDVARTATDADALGQYLAKAVRTREPLTVRVVTSTDRCATDDAPCCLQLTDDENARVATLAVVGEPQTHVIALDLAWDDALVRFSRLLKAYVVERCQRDTFASWVRELPTSVVRSRLGLSDVA